MHKISGSRKAQGIAEYAILIAVIVAAAMAMQIYVSRGLKGGLKYGVDRMPAANIAQRTLQYEPYYLESDYTTTEGEYEATEETKQGGEVVRSSGEQRVSRTGTQKITPLQNVRP